MDDSFKYWDTDEEGSFIHPADCMQQMLEQVRRHKVNIDGNICTVIVTTMVLEGWQRKLDPTYDVMEALQSLLFKADVVDSVHQSMDGLMAP
ncbi:hypothetical protein M569_12556 [Genlisea aurea]|uniref:Uncharacterized protein n=1 Tax=Genlisea aurea TaxID=192259 RepID=S8CCR8_9LAMI|nr:hypothetical protein M569_12556 [Genlisea aurea]